MRIPFLEAPPIPPKKVSGTLMTRAHGQLTTRNIRALYSQVGKLSEKLPDRSGGKKASNTAAQTTIGVYILAKRVMNVSLLDFFSAAFSTRSIILDAVLSLKFFVVRTFIAPDRFTHPEITSSPAPASLGTLSPVSATVFSDVAPSIICPSRGTFSPGRITITSPTLTSSGLTSKRLPSLSTLALSGRISIR